MERGKVTVNLVDPSGEAQFYMFKDALTEWVEDGNVLRVNGTVMNGYDRDETGTIDYPRERVFSIKRG